MFGRTRKNKPPKGSGKKLSSHRRTAKKKLADVKKAEKNVIRKEKKVSTAKNNISKAEKKVADLVDKSYKAEKKVEELVEKLDIAEKEFTAANSDLYLYKAELSYTDLE